MKDETEHTLLDGLQSVLKRIPEQEAVVIKHADAFTAGYPDLSITMNGRTIWWEAKYAKPTIKGTGLQLLTARRLAKVGECWYIVYQQTGSTIHETHIVRPSAIGVNGYFRAEQTAQGYDHEFVYRFILSRYAAS